MNSVAQKTAPIVYDIEMADLLFFTVPSFKLHSFR